MLLKRLFSCQTVLRVCRGHAKKGLASWPYHYRCYHDGETERKYTVTVVGGAGHFGKIISFVLKFSPMIKELRVYDVAPSTAPMGWDLAQIPTDVRVRVYLNKGEILEALECTNVVVIAGGIFKNTDRKHALLANSDTVDEVIKSVARSSMSAHIIVAANPVNCLVPYASVLMRKHGLCNINRLYGATLMHQMRAHVMIADLLCLPLDEVNVPVIGGNSATTIVPIFSHCEHAACLDEEDKQAILQTLRTANFNPLGSNLRKPPLAAAYAISKLVHDILRSLDETEDVITTAFVSNPCSTSAPFFASEFRVGREGVLEILPLPEMEDEEQEMLDSAVQDLIKDIHSGLEVAFCKDCRRL